MTNQEAIEMPWDNEQTIENLKMIKASLQRTVRRTNLDGKREDDAKEVAFDFDRAIAALEKQIPKKPEQVQELNDGRKVGWCPTCKYAQNYENWNHCHNCGQKLDWSD